MQLEFHQLDLRWEHLRVREPHRQRHLLASLAESGQQTPIVVVTSKDGRYLVIDGYKRIATGWRLSSYCPKRSSAMCAKEASQRRPR
jgi:transposase InsO family protein